MPFTAAECAKCRLDFPALGGAVDGHPLAFLDGPAGTQVPEPVIAAIAGYYRTSNANTHGEFPTSRETDRLIDATRETVAAFLGAPSGREISFGQNMTTLNFSLSHALAREMAPGDEIVITQLDHEANRGPWLAPAERGIVVREVALRPDGRLDAEDFARQVTAADAPGGPGARLERARHGQRRRAGPPAVARGRAPGCSSTPSTTPPTSPSTSWRSTPTSCSARPTSSTARTSASSTRGPACSNACAPTSSASRTTRPPSGSRPARSTTPPSPG